MSVAGGWKRGIVYLSQSKKNRPPDEEKPVNLNLTGRFASVYCQKK
jgi:hypothetical protein